MVTFTDEDILLLVTIENVVFKGDFNNTITTFAVNSIYYTLVRGTRGPSTKTSAKLVDILILAQQSRHNK